MNIRAAVAMAVPALVVGLVIIYFVPFVRERIAGVNAPFIQQAMSYRFVQILLVGAIALVGFTGATFLARRLGV